MSKGDYSHEKTMALLFAKVVQRRAGEIEGWLQDGELGAALETAVFIEKKALELRIHLEKMHDDPDYMNHGLGLLALARSAYEQHLGTGQSLVQQGVVDEPWKESNGGRAYVSAEDRVSRKD